MKICNAPNELEAIKSELQSLNQAKHSSTLVWWLIIYESWIMTHNLQKITCNKQVNKKELFQCKKFATITYDTITRVIHAFQNSAKGILYTEYVRSC